MGPITLPKAGVSIELTPKNLVYYGRCIQVYEGHQLTRNPAGGYLLDGEPATHYTFEMDYYFMMGDNRYSSLDSRFWGFVPEDHIVGKPVMVLFNHEAGVGMRWNRTFNSVE
jgi:signal peptidase I